MAKQSINNGGPLQLYVMAFRDKHGDMAYKWDENAQWTFCKKHPAYPHPVDFVCKYCLELGDKRP